MIAPLRQELITVNLFYGRSIFAWFLLSYEFEENVSATIFVSIRAPRFRALSALFLPTRPQFYFPSLIKREGDWGQAGGVHRALAMAGKSALGGRRNTDVELKW